MDYATEMKPANQPHGWIELTDNLDTAGTLTIFQDLVATRLPKAFYRVRDVTP